MSAAHSSEGFSGLSLLHRLARGANGPPDVLSWFLHRAACRRPALFSPRFFRAVDTSNPELARQRAAWALQQADQAERLQTLIAALLPLSRRREGLANDLKQLASSPPGPLARISVPTLIVHGEDDTTVPFAQARTVAAAIDGAELFPVPRCGHLVWLGPDADRVRERLRKFLFDHAPGRTSL